MRLILLWLVPLACSLAQAAPPVVVEFIPPPPFGYGVGSLIRHRAELFVASPGRLDTAQLPTLGPVNDWLEIRDFNYEQQQESGGIRYRIRIDYQIFPALEQATVLEIPPLPLTFITSAGAQQSVSLPAWSFTATPLIPPQWNDAQVEIRPLWQPQAIDLAPHWQRLTGIGVGLLLLGSALAWRSGRLSWRKLPFARALPKIRRAACKREAEAAFRAFHQALNETAGRALFAPHLADFLRHKPAFAPLEEDFRQFFENSRQLFYNLRDPNPQWLIGLERLCRACAKVEKRCRK